jgi:hypothetical protein
LSLHDLQSYHTLLPHRSSSFQPLNPRCCHLGDKPHVR